MITLKPNLSAATGLKNSQFNRKKNFFKALLPIFDWPG